MRCVHSGIKHHPIITDSLIRKSWNWIWIELWCILVIIWSILLGINKPSSWRYRSIWHSNTFLSLNLLQWLVLGRTSIDILIISFHFYIKLNLLINSFWIVMLQPKCANKIRKLWRVLIYWYFYLVINQI